MSSQFVIIPFSIGFIFILRIESSLNYYIYLFGFFFCFFELRKFLPVFVEIIYKGSKSLEIPILLRSVPLSITNAYYLFIS